MTASPPAAPDGTFHAPAHSVVWLRALIVASLVLPTVLFAVLAWDDYRAVIARAGHRTEQTTRIAREHALKLLETNEAIAGRVLDLLGHQSPAALRAQESRIHDRLGAYTSGFAGTRTAYAVAADGSLIASSRGVPVPRDVDLSDREYFLAHKDRDAGPYIAGPLFGRVDKETFFNLSRRWETKSGGFAGVVMVSFPTDYLVDFYRQAAKDDPGLSVAMLRSNGVVLARYPDAKNGGDLLDEAGLASAMAATTDAGIITRIAQIDGKKVLVSIQRIGQFPAFVAVAREYASIMTEWWDHVLALAGLAFSAALALFLMSWMALTRTLSERAAVAHWRSEAERRMAAEDELRQSQKLEAVGQLTGGIAHDFNNLLQVVSNYVHIQRSKHAAGGVEPQIDAVARTVARGQSLIRHLLAFARRQPLQPVVVDLAEWLPGACELLRHSLRGDVLLRCHVEPGTWRVMADAADLEVALLNLVVNSRDAIEGAGRIDVDVRNAESQGDAPGRFVAISVTDTGCGIPPEILRRVFDPFFTTKAIGKGTGLGLSRVYGFAAQSGGKVTVKSEVGTGTTFTMYLPCARDAAAASETRAAPRLLVVEDDAEVAESTMGVLARLGYESKLAENGERALELLEGGETYDLLFSDILMPGTNGVALARICRERYPSLPILLTTGYSNEADAARAEGFAILMKPHDLDSLIGSIQKAMRTRNAGRREPPGTDAAGPQPARLPFPCAPAGAADEALARAAAAAVDRARPARPQRSIRA